MAWMALYNVIWSGRETSISSSSSTRQRRRHVHDVCSLLASRLVHRGRPRISTDSPGERVFTYCVTGLCYLSRSQSPRRCGPVSRVALCRSTTGRLEIPWPQRSCNGVRRPGRVKCKRFLRAIHSSVFVPRLTWYL